MTITDTHA